MTTQSATLDPGPRSRLPLLGEQHPLRRRFRRTMVWSAVIAMTVHLAAAGARYGVARYLAARRPPEEKVVRFVSIDQVVPPSVSEEEAPPQVALSGQVSAPSVGIPEPVPDYEATDLTMATSEELSSNFEGSDLSSLTGGSDSLVVGLGNDLSGGPREEFAVVEEMPALIYIPKPDYPQIARTAGIEGVVQLRVRVGVNGDVEQVVVIGGPDMLREAAIGAAKQAKFRPALEHHRPVSVWVILPLEFSLTS